MLGALFLLLFLVSAAAMATGRLPALVALPAFAIATGLVAGAAEGWGPGTAAFPDRFAAALTGAVRVAFGTVVPKGVVRLADPVFLVMLGGAFGELLRTTGAAEALVRRVAELAGDRSFSLTVLLSLVVSLLFTTLAGLGSVILVANVVFPVLLSLGIPPVVVGSSFLMAFSLGGVFNLANWGLYQSVLGLQSEVVLAFALRFGALYLVVLLAFLGYELRRARIPVSPRDAVVATGAGLVLAALAALRPGSMTGPGVAYAVGLVAFLLVLAPPPAKGVSWRAFLAPVVPLAAVAAGGLDLSAAFVLGILFLLRVGERGDRVQALSRAVIEGIRGVAPAVALMMGIGMVLVAVTQPAVREALVPILRGVVPSSPLGYVVGFGLLAPLALYRGPFNLWGMGSGIVGIVKESGALGPVPVMAAFLSTGQIQGVCDPTNTHNVWIANQLGVETSALLKCTLPWMWLLAFGGLILGVPGG